MQAGDTVWHVSLAELAPVRGVVERVTLASAVVRLDSGSTYSSVRTAFHATREAARVEALARLDRMIERRREVIAEAEVEMADLQRVRDAYAGCADTAPDTGG